MPEELHEGVSRAKIPWDPKIDYKKCTTCGKCVGFCHTGAYRFEVQDGKKRTVVNPNKCIVFCRGCEDICPTSAITHPSEEQTQKIVKKLKRNLGGSKLS
jgi:ferredoxin